MSRPLTRRMYLATLLVPLVAAQSSATTLVYDDFEDGNIADGDPVSWNRGPAQQGDLVLSGTGVTDASILQSDLSRTDMSVRTVFAMVDGPLFGVSARASGSSYFGWLGVDETGAEVGLATGGNLCCTDLADPVEVDVDPRVEDVAMQLDIFADNIQLRVWPADELMPAAPTVVAVDSQVASSGRASAWVAGDDWDQPNPQDEATGRFRFVLVADSPIYDGDYDGDLDVDGSDFLGWQRGESPDPASNSDLDIWEVSFGAATVPTGASGAAAPEPTTAALLAAASLAVCGRFLRRRAAS